MKSFLVLMKREIWENPAFYFAPLVVAALILVSGIYNAFYSVGKYVGFERVVQLLGTIPEAARPIMYSWWPALVVVFNMVMVFVLGFYLMDSLYADRKDRSILFWKSLPVPDSTTVLSKLATAMFTVPLFTLLVTIGSFLVLLVVCTIMIWLGGGSAWELVWKPTPLLDGTLFLSYAFLVQSLWYLPLIGWVMLASAWSRRAPFIWVVLPPVALILLEQMILRSQHLVTLIAERMVGVFPLAFRIEDSQVRAMQDNFANQELSDIPQITDLIDPTPLLTSIDLWLGFAVAGLFIGAAIWLRRYRDET